jgi:alpha-tubulin suppressor-like RCC1 family protein
VPPGAVFTNIAAGFDHSLALKNDGTVIAWGNNFDGQATVPAGSSNVVAIAAGAGGYSLALKSDGTVVGWGYNGYYGQITIPASATNVTAIAAG